MRVVWTTDLHLDRFPRFLNARLLSSFRSQRPDALLVTGDITTFPRLREHLELLASSFDRVLFVLGNHDAYGASFSDIESIGPILPGTWLERSGPIDLDEGAHLVGVDGWYDGASGDASFMDVNFDRLMVRDLALLHGGEERRALCAERAERSANSFLEKMARVPLDVERVIVATHVPPWPGPTHRLSDAFWLPQSVNGALGRAIESAAGDRPSTEFDVVCGHVHREFVVRPAGNVVCRTLRARRFRSL